MCGMWGDDEPAESEKLKAESQKKKKKKKRVVQSLVLGRAATRGRSWSGAVMTCITSAMTVQTATLSASLPVRLRSSGR